MFSRDWLVQHGHKLPDLAVWLQFQIRQGLPQFESSGSVLARASQALPSELQHALAAWASYYQGNYPEASRLFLLAIDAHTQVCGTQSLADAALGMGKVYTRTGHWQAARDWLLHALYLHRQDERLFGLVQGYGALAELFLRAGQSQAAHACMSTAFHLLPAGSGQQARQLNYLASTLMRTGAWLRAESLLMTSLHMARDANDHDSVWHALARLQFLALDRAQENDLPDVLLAMQRVVPDQPTPVAQAFLHIGRSIRFWRCHDREAARQAACMALEALESPAATLPFERRWANCLLAAIDARAGIVGSVEPVDPVLVASLALAPARAPAVSSVVDLTWAQLPLPGQNGFECLLEAPSSFEAVVSWRSRFFI